MHDQDDHLSWWGCFWIAFLKRIIPGIVLFVFILTASAVGAAEIKGVHFQDSVTISNEIVHIRGVGLLRWFFFKVYVAALYLPDDVSSDEVLNHIPKRIEFRYFVDMTADQFAESAEPYLKKNVPHDELLKLRPKINEINQMYRDVSPGDRYTLTFIPGKGTELSLNGKVLGRIEGRDFAGAYYRIWLGEQPLDHELKRALLNKDD